MLTAQLGQNDWKKVDLNKTNEEKKTKAKLAHQYSEFQTYNISIKDFKKHLIKQVQEITIPNAKGNFDSFIIEPVKVVAEEVAHLYTIKTFRGHSIKNPHIIIACDISDGGFHAAIYNGSNSYYIEPILAKSPNNLVVFENKAKIAAKVKCHFKNETNSEGNDRSFNLAPTTKRTFKLAIAAAGEYSQEFGGNPYNSGNVLNALASGVNMMNPIYLRDNGVEFTLVSTTALVYQNPNSDPFDTVNGDLLSASHTACVNALGVNGFDVGHLVIWDDLGGLASFGVVCNNNSKGEAFSAASSSTTTLWVDYVCHELGHQFKSEHNFAANCQGNSAGGFRYEPGEGSSIMSYANVCNFSDNYSNGSDPYFHYSSISQIQTFLNTINCAVSNSSGNASDPIADAKSNITIPKNTPFVLVGSASDGNDPLANLTYNWEQYDGTSPVASGNPNCNATSSPLFRYRPPVSDNFRALPPYNNVLAGNNNSITWEKLPCVARTLNFSLAVRDNNVNFGRVTHDQMQVTVSNTGPFELTSPNGGQTLSSSTTVTWNVNGTNSHCPNIDILVSTDGGTSYTVIADATPNDGSQTINFTNNSTTARILIRCDVPGGFRNASTFYDTSNGNFTISGVASNPCYSDLTNANGLGTNETGTVDYESSTFINTTAPTVLQSGSKVDYDATTTICLNSGFEVKVGAEFDAFIDGCNNGSGGNNIGGEIVNNKSNTKNSVLQADADLNFFSQIWNELMMIFNPSKH